MSSVRKTQIVRIGNSRGIRIPKVWLDQLELGVDVELELESDQIIIRSARRPRQDWDEQFRRMAEAGEDRLLDPVMLSTWDVDEWQW